MYIRSYVYFCDFSFQRYSVLQIFKLEKLICQYNYINKFLTSLKYLQVSPNGISNNLKRREMSECSSQNHKLPKPLDVPMDSSELFIMYHFAIHFQAITLNLYTWIPLRRVSSPYILHSLFTGLCPVLLSARFLHRDERARSGQEDSQARTSRPYIWRIRQPVSRLWLRCWS